MVGGLQAYMMRRCLQRLEWTRVKEGEIDEMKAEKERERMAMMLIDWHDFSVVRTIDFDPNEDVSRLGPPLTKQMVIQLNKGADADAGMPDYHSCITGCHVVACSAAFQPSIVHTRRRLFGLPGGERYIV